MRPFQRRAESDAAATIQAPKLAITPLQLGPITAYSSLTLTLDFAQIGHLSQFTAPLNLQELIEVVQYLRALIRGLIACLLRAERHQAGWRRANYSSLWLCILSSLSPFL